MGNCCDKLCLRHLTGTNVIYLFGDKMPHKDQVRLPSWKIQKDVYHRYVGDMTRRGISEEEVAGISVFYKVWMEEFSNVQVWTILCLLLCHGSYTVRDTQFILERLII